MDKRFAEPYLAFAYIYRDKGHEGMEKAEKYLNKAIKRDPNFASAYRELGNIYASQELYNEAITQFKKAINISPSTQSLNSYRALARIYRKKGNHNKAIQMLEKANKIAPSQEIKHSIEIQLKGLKKMEE